MQPRNSATPVIIALIIAVVGTLVLLNMDLPRMLFAIAALTSKVVRRSPRLVQG
jgi:hypothetical protein